jgi:hypothetical protein
MTRRNEASEIEEKNEVIDEKRQAAILIATGLDSTHMTVELTAFLTT